MARWRAVIEAGLDSDPADAVQVWTDLTSYVRDSGQAIHMTRGRQEDSRSFNPGKLTVMFDNRLRTFDPAVDPRVRSEKAVRYSLEYPWLPGLIPNGGMSSATGWTVQGTASGLTAMAGGMGVSYDGGPGYLTCSCAAGASGGIVSGAFPVKATTSYAGSVRLRPTLAINGFMSVDWYSAPGGGGSLLRTDISPVVALTANKWNRVDFPVVTSPGTAQSAVVHFYTDTIASTTGLDFDSGVLDQASFGGLYPQIVTYADSWQRDWDVGDSLCVLSATDGFKPMGFMELNSADYITLIDSLAPSHHYRLSETGVNRVPTSFKDHVTGDVLAHSTIDTGVGPLYNVPGMSITEVDGAFSAVGPSSSDSGHVDVPKKYSLSGLLNHDWTINIWARSPGVDANFGVSGQMPIFSQGAPLFTNDYLYLTVARNGDTTFGIMDGTTLVLLGTNFSLSGIHLQDQLPHQYTVTYIASAKTYGLYIDGVLVDHQTAAAHLTLQQRTTVLAASVGAVTITAYCELDEFSIWNNTALAGSDIAGLYARARRLYPAEKSDARIGRILDLVNWPSALRRLGPGSSLLGAVSQPFSKANPLQYLQQIEESEQGWLLMDKAGNAWWISRYALYQDRTIQATFGNGGGSEVPYERAQPIDDNRRIINDAQYSIQSGGQLQRFTDATSKQQFRIRTDSKTNLLLYADEDAMNAAEWTVDHYKSQRTRIQKLELNPVYEDLVIAQVILREIADRVIVRTRPVGAAPGTYVAFDVRILGMDHVVSRGKIKVTWDLSTAYTKDYFILGDTLGSYPMGW